MKTETAQKNVEKLMTLIKENPELPIVPMVSAELFADDYGWWLGGWGSAEIEYMANGADYKFLNEEEIYFESQGKHEQEIIDHIFDEFPELNEHDVQEKYKDKSDEIKWKKVIVARITTPR
jgi:hypothetical protein